MRPGRRRGILAGAVPAEPGRRVGHHADGERIVLRGRALAERRRPRRRPRSAGRGVGAGGVAVCRGGVRHVSAAVGPAAPRPPASLKGPLANVRRARGRGDQRAAMSLSCARDVGLAPEVQIEARLPPSDQQEDQISWLNGDSWPSEGLYNALLFSWGGVASGCRRGTARKTRWCKSRAETAGGGVDGAPEASQLQERGAGRKEERKRGEKRRRNGSARLKDATSRESRIRSPI